MVIEKFILLFSNWCQADTLIWHMSLCQLSKVQFVFGLMPFQTVHCNILECHKLTNPICCDAYCIPANICCREIMVCRLLFWVAWHNIRVCRSLYMTWGTILSTSYPNRMQEAWWSHDTCNPYWSCMHGHNVASGSIFSIIWHLLWSLIKFFYQP